VTLANPQAARAGLSNYRAIQSPSEQLDPELLAGADTIIVDPPRAGLTTAAIELLAAAAPRQIIYLSCNPVTQVRDIMLLAEHYTPGAPVGFDFYPGALHLESLVVLTRRPA
jgi:23S rRNA (uracil1939-C5)-methyltransferase